jgi:hypothetical protein
MVNSYVLFMFKSDEIDLKQNRFKFDVNNDINTFVMMGAIP